jgi:hypothetical protein
LFKTSSLAATALLVLVSTQAYALNTRTWISGKGIDQAGCGAIGTPCRTLQYAHDQTNAHGEIDVLDAAGYGSLLITKAISVVNDGVGVAGVLAVPGGNAIAVIAGSSDDIVLRGLTVEGANVGANGIVFSVGASLNISNCVVQNFVGNDNTHGNGILIEHSSGTPNIVISNVTVSNNKYIGVSYIPSVFGGGVLSVDRLVATNNKLGFAIYTLASGNPTLASVTNSIANNNIVTGFQIIGANTFLDSISAFQNQTGVYIQGDDNHVTHVTINRSSGANNPNFDLQTFGVAAFVVTYHNNAFPNAVTTFSTINPY